MEILNNSNYDEKNPYIIEDYPYGRLRTQMRVWVESDIKRGDRVMRQTQNPKTFKWNNPKKSTYMTWAFLMVDSKGFVETKGFDIYSDKDELKSFLDKNKDKFNSIQTKRYDMNYSKSDKSANKTVIKGRAKWERGYNSDEITALRLSLIVPKGVDITYKNMFDAVNKSMTKQGLIKMNELYDNGGTIFVSSGRNILFQSSVKRMMDKYGKAMPNWKRIKQ